MNEQKIRSRKTAKAIDPDTVIVLIGLNDRLTNVREVLNHVYAAMPDDLASGAVYGMMCALDGIKRDLYDVTAGTEI